MIHYIKGNLFDSQAQAFVNTVNTVGVMGKGIALQFKNIFPNNFKQYAKACKEGTFQIGNLLITNEMSFPIGEKIVINFPTKTDWRKPSEYAYIEQGLQSLVKIIQENKIRSIAIPPLGAGNGGLEWGKVKIMMEKYLSPIDCEVHIYQPDAKIQEVLRKERVALTPARAMLLAVLYDLVADGEFVSEFSSEKIAYFLQRFGAKEVFKLDFQPNFYGPYSGKVKHVLYYLNGSYLNGYGSKDKKPFDEIDLVMDGQADVFARLQMKENEAYCLIVEKTKDFLTGFYSDFALELLSTLDYIAQKEHTTDINVIKAHLHNWSNRKKTLFDNDTFIEQSLNKLVAANLFIA
jgi:O-acetyl-ADP-ribose deacetylase (regulator of RNase III)/uncharacterized protein YwgA